MAEIRSADVLVDKLLSKHDVQTRLQGDLEGTLRRAASEAKLATAFGGDIWVYRLVVAFLGITVLTVAIGTVFLSMHYISSSEKGQIQIPDGLIALGSAAVGALAGLLAPAPSRTA